tara:strand:- start:2353 stop:4110 length:1758 start_codon:yes stop_codon:yes gene_type:complete
LGILYGKYAQASNDLTSRDLFLERSFYKHYVDSPSAFPPLDLWESKHHYGRADYWHTAVYPSEYNLKQLPTKRGTIFALDFVADAFMAFREEYKTMSLGTIASEADSFFIGEFEPKRGWVSVHKEYHRHMTMLYKAFSAFILMSPERKLRMTSFDNFMNLFWQFFDTVLPAFPITRTGYIYSKYCNPRISGLVLEIMKMDHDKDLPKEYMFEDLNFEAYAATAAKHGFYIDKNAPWRLIAKLGSAKLEPYMREYGITSLAPFSAQEEVAPNSAVDYFKKDISVADMLKGNLPPASLQQESNYAGLVGETSMEQKHNHTYYVDVHGNGYANIACHDKFTDVCHGHLIENWQVLPASSKDHDPYGMPLPPWGQNSSDPHGVESHIHVALPPKDKPKAISQVSYDNVFKKYFYQSFMTDIESLKVYARSFYNSFVAANEYIRIPETDWCSSAQATKAFYKRINGVTREDITLRYQLPYWIRFYLKIRAREAKQNLTDRHLDYLMKRVEFQLDYRGPTNAMNFANALFEGTIRKKHTPTKNINIGGYNPGVTSDKVKQTSQKEIDDILQSTEESYDREQVEEIKKTYHY